MIEILYLISSIYKSLQKIMQFDFYSGRKSSSDRKSSSGRWRTCFIISLNSFFKVSNLKVESFSS
jgi:hypothetical protein